MAWKSICAKVPDEFREEVLQMAATSGRTLSDFVRICVEDVVHGHYRLEGEHLVPTQEYLDALVARVDQEQESVDHREYSVDLTRLERISNRARKDPQDMLDYLLNAYERRE